MSWLAWPLLAQGAAMLVDEFFFHYRRGLPRWERLGHPLDTATVLACFALASLAEPTGDALGAFAALALLSCLAVTKDEWVHARWCSPGEQWLHSLLFLLHPTCLIACAYLWALSRDRSIIHVQTGILAVFLGYQLIYWNLIRAPDALTETKLRFDAFPIIRDADTLAPGGGSTDPREGKR